MDDLSLRLMQLAASGYCCSQILMALALETQGVENPDLVRSMAGLCNGMGDCSEVCGALAGGLCVLALYSAKGTDEETEQERYPLMISQLGDWFRETIGSECGGIRCSQILGERQCGRPDKERCGGIIARTFKRCMEILVENGLDPSEPKGK